MLNRRIGGRVVHGDRGIGLNHELNLKFELVLM